MTHKWPVIIRAWGFGFGSTGNLSESAGTVSGIRNAEGDYSLVFAYSLTGLSQSTRYTLMVFPSRTDAITRNVSAVVQESSDPFRLRFVIRNNANDAVDNNFRYLLLLPG